MTSSINYHFEYCFHPVGQGLFASGIIQQAENDSPCFQWVYDCGTSSSQKLVKNGIANLPRRNNGRSHLDLVTISHFDNDHVSGIAELISNFSIDMLLLPYMPLWQRLAIAFEEGIWANQALMEFFVNPVSYLKKIPGAEITQILLVHPSGENGPPIPGENINNQYQGDEAWKIAFKAGEPIDKDEDISFNNSAKGTGVAYIEPGNALLVAGLWEFVPYNDAKLAPQADDPFQHAVEEKKITILNSKSTIAQREAALKELKELYDGQFGRGSEKRNIISLFVYSGPFDLNSKTMALDYYKKPIHWNYLPDCCYLLRTGCLAHFRSRKCSILYTGDGYLNTEKRLNRLKGFFGTKRVAKVGVFQVMHHGAEGNWHPGVARRIEPIFSIFSSDPQYGRLKHPHAPVLRDFWLYGPIQVDKRSGAAFWGTW